MSQVDENGIVVVPTIISGVSGSLAFMPADISTSSYALTGSDLEDFIRETASFTLDANNNELKITIPATHSNLTEDVIPLYITASGINPRVGVGVTSPLTTFDFKDVEDATTGTELLLRNSRTSEGAQVGDSAGKLFFTIDSSSFTDVKTEGAIATIETQVDSVDYTGVTGELIFSVAQGKSVAPVNKLKINPTLTQITGSLDVTTDVSGSGLYFSSSGQSFINRLAIGSNTTLTGFQRLYVAGDSLFHGDVELGNQASDIINIHGIVEITGSVTSSADISASGDIIGGTITSNGYGVVSQSGVFATNEFIVASTPYSVTSSDALAVDSDGNLGIGTPNPEVRLHMLGEAAQTTQILMEQFNDTADAPDIRTRRYRGTSASRADVQAGDYLFRLNVHGQDDGASELYGSMQFDVDSSDQDALNWRIQTRDTGGTVADRITIDSSGKTVFAGNVEFENRELINTTNSDQYYGDVVTFGGGGTLTQGSIYYLNSSQNWALADASAASTAQGMLGIATSTGIELLVKGIARHGGWAGFTTGTPVYLSETAGELTTTKPTTSGAIVRVVGYSTNGTVREIYFNPSTDWIELA